ncbi:cyclin-A1-2 [Planoprotostelium fungivorum]|uniref:Cyclin-A1-2 n=1 Tax=Planoprotostelium fungivorum TaxID=1890364 RepID=A0A2P6NUP0_9EUKA|nr:cyclin-A1-2 [Planoprotostelium fungivorum]
MNNQTPPGNKSESKGQDSRKKRGAVSGEKGKRPALQDISNRSIGKTTKGKRSATKTVQSVSRTTRSQTRNGPPSANKRTSAHSSQSSDDSMVDPTNEEYFDPMDSSEPEVTEQDLFYSQQYSADIYRNTLRSEIQYQPKFYLPSAVHQELTPKMRSILIDWLVEVAIEFKLNSETLFLAVNYIDRFLSTQSVPKSKLQLLGVTCMMIAAKFEEVWPPSVEDFIFISDNCYTKQEIFAMEVKILNELKFKLVTPTVKCFLKRYLTAAGFCDGDQTVENFCHYLSEMTLLDFEYLRYLPSMLAAAILCISMHTIARHAWNISLQQYTGYSFAIPEFKLCIMRLADCINQPHVYKSVDKKYSKFLTGDIVVSSLPWQ